MTAWGLTKLTLCAAVAIGAALLPAAATASGNTYYAQSGTGATSCAESDPCTLPHALSLANADSNPDGDSIVLKPDGGPFTPAFIGITHAFDIGGLSGAATPVISGPNSGDVMTISNPSAHLHDVTIQQSGGGTALNVSAGLVERVTVAAEDTNGACALGDATLIDTVCWESASGFGIATPYTGINSSRLVNVTAVSTGLSGSGVLPFAISGGDINHIDAVNLLALGATAGVSPSQAGGGVASISLTNSDYTVHDAGGSFTPVGTNGNISTPPLLVNTGAGDFHELAGSPTIDAGFAAPDIGGLDLGRNPRISPVCAGGPTGTPDIGAYEFNSALTACPVPAPPKKKCKKKKKHHRASAAKKSKKCKKKRKK